MLLLRLNIWLTRNSKNNGFTNRHSQFELRFKSVKFLKSLSTCTKLIRNYKQKNTIHSFYLISYLEYATLQHLFCLQQWQMSARDSHSWEPQALALLAAHLRSPNIGCGGRNKWLWFYSQIQLHAYAVRFSGQINH